MYTVKPEPPHIIRLSRSWDVADAVFLVVFHALTNERQAAMHLNIWFVVVNAKPLMVLSDAHITTPCPNRVTDGKTRQPSGLVCPLNLGLGLPIPRAALPT
jgi:hypothetical protein